MQTSQSFQRPTGRAGQILGDLDQFGIRGDHVVGVAADAGTFVCEDDVDPGLCRPPTSAAEVQVAGLGFLMYDPSKGSGTLTAAATNDYSVGNDGRIVKHGPRMLVTSTEQMAKGDPVFVQYGSTAADRGKVRNDASTGGSAAAQLHGAVVLAAYSASLCEISILLDPQA